MKLLRKREMFRWCVYTADALNIWVQDRFNLNPKRAILEAQQDLTSLEELERTIGKSLGIKHGNKNS